MRESFPAESWNVYAFHWSDGDNYTDDNEPAMRLLGHILPGANLFCYGQVDGSYGNGSFRQLLQEEVGDETKLVTASIRGREDIYTALRAFLGTGR